MSPSRFASALHGKLLHYKYLSYDGGEIEDAEEYSGSLEDAIRDLKAEFDGSATPITEINGQRIPVDMTAATTNGRPIDRSS